MNWEPILITLFGASGIGAIVKLVHWLVTTSFERQDAMTDRFVNHLKEDATRRDVREEKMATALNNVADSVNSVAETQRMNMQEFRQTVPTICLHSERR
jgi:hypothetical protein